MELHLNRHALAAGSAPFLGFLSAKSPSRMAKTAARTSPVGQMARLMVSLAMDNFFWKVLLFLFLRAFCCLDILALASLVVFTFATFFFSLPRLSCTEEDFKLL